VRVQALKSSVLRVFIIVMWAPVSVALAQAAGVEPQAPPALPGPTDSGEEGAPAGEAQEEEEPPAFRWDPYGYIKLDASVDSSAIDIGNFARWAADPALATDHNHFNITARQTRLGLRVHGPEEKSFGVLGRVEIDFYGGGGENKNGVMLRHAYIQVDWADKDLTLVAGQTSDLISPLVPRTVNYTVAWWVGNIGYRRPLVAVHKRFGTAGGQRLTLTAGASRTIGDDFKPAEPGDAGADSGLPSVQGRVAYSWGMGGKNAELGLSGHWGQENVGGGNGFHDEQLDSWSANLDFLVPVSKSVVVKGEVFAGDNLDDYFGGIGQGVNHELGRDVGSTGGWVAVELDPSSQIQTGFGVGLEDPRDSDLNAGQRAFNQAIWGNVFYSFTSYLKAGAEVSYWKTDYKDGEQGKAWRYQHTVIFTF